jgi:hypothetical protein
MNVGPKNFFGALHEPDQIYYQEQKNRWKGAGQRVTLGKEIGDSFI